MCNGTRHSVAYSVAWRIREQYNYIYIMYYTALVSIALRQWVKLSILFGVYGCTMAVNYTNNGRSIFEQGIKTKMTSTNFSHTSFEFAFYNHCTRIFWSLTYADLTSLCFLLVKGNDLNSLSHTMKYHIMGQKGAKIHIV